MRLEELRLSAENRLGALQRDTIEAFQDLASLAREIEVHRVELEIQNEELRTKEDALARVHRRIAALYELAPVGFVTIDLDTRILEANARASTLLAEARRALIGSALSSFVAEEEVLALHLHVRSAAESREKRSAELRIVDRLGRASPVLLESIGLEEGGVQVALLDLTELRAKDAELERSRSALRRARKNAAFGRLSAAVAHDIGNVLSAMVSAAELALRRISHEHPARKLVDEIREIGIRGAALPGRLRALERRPLPRSDWIAIDEVVAHAEAMFGRVLGDAVSLTIAAAAGGERVGCDRDDLERVLLNLVMNARDAMPSGGAVRIETRRVNGERGEPWIEIAITDSGCGMDDETKGRIFEPFFTTKPPESGSGLGLWSSLTIVAGAGGRIDVESEPGRGSKFTVRLPAAER